MKYKRSAYTLLEMLAVIAAIVVMMALSVKPMRTLALHIPRSNRDFQTWTKTEGMLELLKKDVEDSTQINILDVDADRPCKLISLQHPKELIRFSLRDGYVIRKTDTLEDSWELPHVRINCQIWKNDTEPYAIEITTWAEHTVSGKVQKKFEQTYVYFQKTGSRK